MATKDPCKVNYLKRFPFIHIYSGGNVDLDSDEGTGCPPWFFMKSAGTKLKGAFKLASPNSNTNLKQFKFKKITNLFFKGYNYLY